MPRSRVRVRRGRPHDLGGELGDHVDQQLLVLGGREVELAGRLGRRRADAVLAARARPGERPAGPGHGAEPAAGDGEDRLLGLLAQPEPVEEVGLGEPAQAGDEVADRVPRLGGRDPVPPARTKVRKQRHAPKCNSELHNGLQVPACLASHPAAACQVRSRRIRQKQKPVKQRRDAQQQARLDQLERPEP